MNHRLFSLLGLAAVGCLAGSASSAGPETPLPVFDEPEAHTIVNPGGVTAQPTEKDLVAAYPATAKARHLNGRASIRCRVTVEGLLTECEVDSEIPVGAGFGQAALSVAHYFKMHSASIDGIPVPGFEVTVPMRFTLFPTEPTPDNPPSVRHYAPMGSGIPAPIGMNSVVLPRERLGLLGSTTNGTLTYFIDLDDQKISGSLAEITLLSVAQKPLYWRSVFSVSRIKINCLKKTSELKFERYFDESGETIGWTFLDYASAVPLREKSAIKEAAQVACQGERTKAIVNGAGEAIRTARTWPTLH
jgi:TonB family protein